MGGKSTLLRQTCLLAILAQIGCYVPCEYYQSIVFDQIFCRIGSSDRIIEGNLCLIQGNLLFMLSSKKPIASWNKPLHHLLLSLMNLGGELPHTMEWPSLRLPLILSWKISAVIPFSAPITHQSPEISFRTKRLNAPRCLINWHKNPIKKKNQTEQKLEFLYQVEPGVA